MAVVVVGGVATVVAVSAVVAEGGGVWVGVEVLPEDAVLSAGCRVEDGAVVAVCRSAGADAVGSPEEAPDNGGSCF